MTISILYHIGYTEIFCYGLRLVFSNIFHPVVLGKDIVSDCWKNITDYSKQFSSDTHYGHIIMKEQIHEYMHIIKG